MADPLARHVGMTAPTIEGMSCLQRVFKNWETAENIARSLGHTVVERVHAGIAWRLVSHQAVAEIAEAFTRRADENEEARDIKGRVSHRIIDAYVHFSSLVFARVLNLTLTRPSGAEEEYFIRTEDIPAIVAEARKSQPQGIGWITAPGTEAALLRWIEDRRLVGIPQQEAERRKANIARSKGPSHSAASWPPY